MSQAKDLLFIFFEAKIYDANKIWQQKIKKKNPKDNDDDDRDDNDDDDKTSTNKMKNQTKPQLHLFHDLSLSPASPLTTPGDSVSGPRLMWLLTCQLEKKPKHFILLLFTVFSVSAHRGRSGNN